MGAVYRAWDSRLNAPVALKEMVPQPGISAQMLDSLREQFRREATVLANLDHPGLVNVLDFFEDRGNAYLVMRFVAGESLAARIQRLGPASESDVLRWADELLDALAYCHARGVLHRDVKPQNVIVRPDGRATLVDFGLVKLWDPSDPRTKTAMRGMGTPEYAPLEQYDAARGHTDQRSDLYGLGATLYHALTGRVPPTITSRILDPGALPHPGAIVSDVHQNTEAAILKAMEVHPGNRFASASEMRDALAADRTPRATETVASSATPDHAPAASGASPKQTAARSSTVQRAGGAPVELEAEAVAARPPDSTARTLAAVGLVLGLLSLAMLGCSGLGGLLGPLPVIVGIVSRTKLAPESRKHIQMALAGIWSGVVAMVAMVVLFGSGLVGG
jgi:serine/threonine-protein kinase